MFPCSIFGVLGLMCKSLIYPEVTSVFGGAQGPSLTLLLVVIQPSPTVEPGGLSPMCVSVGSVEDRLTMHLWLSSVPLTLHGSASWTILTGY